MDHEVNDSVANFPHYLKSYYKNCFPFQAYYRWLSYGDNSYFLRREFSFTIENDIYLRYKSFTSPKDLQVCLQKDSPHKIDIGAIYNGEPKRHKTHGPFAALEREIVFDIDISDYDDVRTCCSGASVCSKCWPLMTVALKILQRALEHDFGFKENLYVFSGRRGVHVWVCDSSARKLTYEGRAALGDYLTLITGGAQQAKKVNIKNANSPPIRAAIDIINDMFHDFISKQDFLKRKDDILALQKTFFGEVALPEKLFNSMCEEEQTSLDKWNLLKDWVASSPKDAPRNVIEEIMVQYCYPRLDINVTKGVNHLLKSPFSCHPKTGKVSVPIDPANFDTFNPDDVPTLSIIYQELQRNEDKENVPTNNTCLHPYLAFFSNFVSSTTKITPQPSLEF